MPGPRMTWNDSEKEPWGRVERKCPLIKVRLGRSAPTRVRKFIPKPLILVERMRARQLLLEPSPPRTSGSCVAPQSLKHATTTMLVPRSAFVTPKTHRAPRRRVLLPDSHSSSSLPFGVGLRDDTTFGDSFGKVTRSLRPSSVVTMGESLASTDTFVADSPCCIKLASSKVPVLAVANAHMSAQSDVGEKDGPDIGIPALVDSVPADFMQRADTFEPTMTSTPFVSSHMSIDGVPSSTAFATSTGYPIRLLEEMPRFLDTLEIASPTSRAVHPFSTHQGPYAVKLPNTGSTMSLSSQTRLTSVSSSLCGISVPYARRTPLAALTNPPNPKPVFSVMQLPRDATPSIPSLVLDGVFALPHAPSSPSSFSLPLTTALDSFPQPRKPMVQRRPLLSDTSMSTSVSTLSTSVSNALRLTSPPRAQDWDVDGEVSTSPTLSLRGHGRKRSQSGPNSPRSKLAHVLTAHVRREPQAMTMTTTYTRAGRRRGRALLPPPLVKGIQVSSDPRTQYEIEELRVRRGYIGLSHGGARVGGGAGDVSGDTGGTRAIERTPFVGVGMVAKLRARWEKGGRVDGFA